MTLDVIATRDIYPDEEVNGFLCGREHIKFLNVLGFLDDPFVLFSLSPSLTHIIPYRIVDFH